MDKIKKLADYLERNKVDAILFAEEKIQDTQVNSMGVL